MAPTYPRVQYPVYRLRAPRVEDSAFDDFAALVDARSSGAGTQHQTDRLHCGEPGSWYLDSYFASGGVWYVDQARSWSAQMPLPVGAPGPQRRATADALFTALRLPPSGTQVHTGFGVDTRLAIVREYRPRLTYVRTRDPVQGVVEEGFPEAGVFWRPFLSIRLAGGMRLRAPVVGSAVHEAAFRGENLVRLDGTWRAIESVDRLVEGVHPRYARAAVLRFLRENGLQDVRATVRLVYPSAPSPDSQELLEPHWAVRARYRRGPRSRRQLLRGMLLPIDLRRFVPISPCSQMFGTTAPIGSDQLPAVPATIAPGLSIGCWWPQDNLLARFSCPSAHRLAAVIGRNGSVPILLGGPYAMYYQWVSAAAEWVERVRIAYVQSHASSDGWSVSLNPSSMSDRGSSMVTTADARLAGHWGSGDLRWIVVGACGPLQDTRAGGSGNAEVNWGDAFKGLHGLLGFADSSEAAVSEGPLFARFLLQGDSVKDAWFKAAAETQRGSRGSVHAAAVLKGPQGDPLSPTPIPPPAAGEPTEYFKYDCA